MKTKKKNKTSPTKVAEYRRNGFKVRVSHDMTPDWVKLRSGGFRKVRGKCYVTITTPDGVDYMGESLCIDKNYDKRMAVKIALRRAERSMMEGKQIVPSFREVSQNEVFNYIMNNY